MEKLVFVVLTISDSCHADPTKDRSGPRLKNLISESFQNVPIINEILPDECELIREKLKKLIRQRNPSISAIITTGGTGFAPRDVTPEATKPLLDKECTALTTAITLASLQKTKFAALTRGVCGIAQNTLIMNFPGSEKAVVECFAVVRDLLPHALQLIGNDLPLVKQLHADIQDTAAAAIPHICPHKVGTGSDADRNSQFPMIPLATALDIIFQTVQQSKELNELLSNFISPVNIPPFRASIKDGYVMKSTGFSGVKKVIGNIAAGDTINMLTMQEDECYKINTGAPIPYDADCVVQIEDTKLLKRKKNGEEDLIEVMIEPKANLDIRPIGCDLGKGTKLFPTIDHSVVVIKSILASVGTTLELSKPKVAVISTGSELLAPHQAPVEGKIFDSNTTMLEELLNYFGFDCIRKLVLSDNFEEVEKGISNLYETVDFVICSGGVSMGDKDYVKSVLEKLNFKIHFGRVNLKPGKPMTYATKQNKYFFGLPGNTVSAFVTFHLFALPAIRWAAGWKREKCVLPQISVILENQQIALDPRPEYMRATITSKNGSLYANVIGGQMSSRLQSVVGADVLVHFPARSDNQIYAFAGDKLTSSVLRYDFISKYE